MTATKILQQLKDDGIAEFSNAYFSKLVKEGKISYTLDGKRKTYSYETVVRELALFRTRPPSHNSKNKIEPTPKAISTKSVEERLQNKDNQDSLAESIRGIGEEISLNDSKVWLTVVQAQTAELKLEQARGELISRAEVESGYFVLARNIRDALLSIPPKLAGMVSGETDPLKNQIIIADTIQEALENLSEIKFDEQ